jgi:hypothetical protein
MSPHVNCPHPGFSFNSVSLRDPEIRRFFVVAPSALIVVNTTICTLLIAGRIWCFTPASDLKFVRNADFSSTIGIYVTKCDE